jgi:hypothetical protein
MTLSCAYSYKGKCFKNIFGNLAFYHGVNYSMGQIIEHHFTKDRLIKDLRANGFCSTSFRTNNLMGNFNALKTIVVYLAGGILRKTGLHSRLVGNKLENAWQQPVLVLKKGLKPHYTHLLSQFGLSMVLKCFKCNDKGQ